MSEQTSDEEKMFDAFNKERQVLSEQFYGLIDLVANHIFSGQLEVKSGKNLLNKINEQQNLIEAEKNLLRNLYFYAYNLQESQFLLGIFGRFKAGKSTLINTLAGEDISPMDTRISTGVLNFTYSSDVEKCTIHYDNGSEETIDPAIKDEYIDFRHNPDNEKGIHSVRHGCPNLDLQKEIVFVDTPGLEAVNSVHEKITLDFVTQCHVAVVVSTYPPFGEGELRFYKRIHKNIPNTFLIQNLPEDKLDSWVPLEAQTLENLHKLEFYDVNKEVYGEQDIYELLRKIGDDKNEKQLQKFKEAHNIHLYTLNALIAYNVLRGKHKQQIGAEGEEILQKSRFLLFKKDLYHFLTNHRGQKLLADYLLKGQIILSELTKMIDEKQEILQQSLEEIDSRISLEEQQQAKTLQFVEMIVDRTNLKILESFRLFKIQIMNEDLKETLGGIKEQYAEKNIYRLSKREVKEIKGQVAAFNRLFGQRYQKLTVELGQIAEDSQENIAEQFKNHNLFKQVSLEAKTNNINVGEMGGVGYLDKGFDFLFHGGIAYLFVQVFGGSNSIMADIVSVGVGQSSAGIVATFLVATVGLVLSIPLAKRMNPFLDKCKAFIGKIYTKPAVSVFEEFEGSIRKKLDDVEISSVDNLQNSFKKQVNKGTKEFFELKNKTLQELRNKKENGDEMQENEKLCYVLDQLKEIEKHFSNIEKQEDQKVESVLKGIKGLLGKFKK